MQLSDIVKIEGGLVKSEFNYRHWRYYLNDITVCSLWISDKKKNDGKWIIPRRSFLPDNDSSFHGLFIPEIPYQFMKRFVNKDDVVWDCFAGSGTTKRVADILRIKCICNDLLPKQDYIVKADSASFNPGTMVNMVFMHPPYWDIIKYSDLEEDGSTKETLDSFYEWFDLIVQNVIKYIANSGYIVLVCGNIYKDGEEYTLGVWLKDIITKYGFKCKSHIIKDYGETKGNFAYNLRYYRCLKHGYNMFYGDNIFLLQKC